MSQVSFLSFDDLPTEFNMFQRIVDLVMKEENHNVAFLNEPFLRNMFALSNEISGCLLFIYNYQFQALNI